MILTLGKSTLAIPNLLLLHVPKIGFQEESLCEFPRDQSAADWPEVSRIILPSLFKDGCKSPFYSYQGPLLISITFPR